MRNLFLALVLANLTFAAWSAWFAPAEHAGRRADDGLPPLTLVSEVPTDLRSSGVVVETAAPEPAAGDAAEPRCNDRDALAAHRAGAHPDPAVPRAARRRARCIRRSRCGTLHERRTVS